MGTATIQFSPLQSAISSEGGTLDLIVRIQASEAPPAAAPTSAPAPKRLALVVDRSGSMAGPPLFEALRCVQHIAQRLTPQDQLAVVVYDNQVSVIQPLAPVNLATLRAQLATVTEGGSTNLFAGWQAGAHELANGPAHAISRVMLLSDGRANHGLTAAQNILPHLQQSAEQGIGTTTVGLGRSFNEELMIAMARTGRGQQYYGQRATDLHDSFDEELQLLQALCLRHLTLELVPAPGVVLQPLGVFDRLPNGHIQLPDLPWDAETWVALRLHLPAACAPTTPHTLLAATLTARTLDGQAVTQHATPLQLPALPPHALAQLPTHPDVATRLSEAHFAQDSQQLANLLARGLQAPARALLQDMQQRHGHHPWLAAKLQRLAELAQRDPDMYRKEASFSSRRTGQRLSAREDTAYAGDETQSTAPAYLRKKAEEGRGRPRA